MQIYQYATLFTDLLTSWQLLLFFSGQFLLPLDVAS